MVFKLTNKGCKVSESSYEYINRHLKKITQASPNIGEGLLVLRLVIKRNIDQYHHPRSRSFSRRNYAQLKPALAYYEGSITFRLNKKQLYSYFKGQTVNECIHTGFDHIFRKLERFKDLHFPSESEYPNHSSIRG